jgi:threonine/homoserine/homoserine lactone efflux protein
MDVINLLVGFAIGMAMSVPVGPLGMIVVKRILLRGPRGGMVSGLGMACGDVVFTSVAIFGVSWIHAWLVQYRYSIEIVGGIIIFFLGLWSFRHFKPSDLTQVFSAADAAKDFASTLVVTIANPQTIIGFSTAFTITAGMYSLETTGHALELVGGVFLGTASWWICFSLLLGRVRRSLNENVICNLHQSAAIFVAILGLGLVLHGVLSW